MDFQFLKYEVREGVARITLNRPDVYNALNDVITYELQDVFKVVAKDDLVRVVVLTGEGKAFCSGQDLKPTSAKATAGEPASAQATAGRGRKNFLQVPPQTLQPLTFTITKYSKTSPLRVYR